MNNKLRWIALGLVATALLVGCGGREGDSVSTNSAPQAMAGGTPAGQATDIQLGSLPGLPMAPAADPAKAFASDAQVVASRYGARNDPFALKPKEQKFEQEQDTLRLLGDMGSWTVMFEPPVERDPNDGLITEPQPYRRLSGIIVGDSVYAILDAEGQTTIIRPGMKLPNSDWTVVSIDETKAVLRRSGNKLPRQVVVRLESPPPGMVPTGGGFNPAPGGGPSGDPALGGGKMGGGMGIPGGGAPSLGGLEGR